MRDRRLAAAYATCRRINARHGKTYFLATMLLPPHARPATHALYGFARAVDDAVDNPAAGSDPGRALRAFDALLDRVFAGRQAHGPVELAFGDTVRRYALDRTLFDAFLRSMRMDLHTREYASFAALREYTHGSASVIGSQMLPVLGTVTSREEAEPYAEALGEAFQLTNFLRDIGEDLDRGRLYLPLSELAAFGVDRELLEWSWRTGRPDRRVRRALAALVAHNRAVYRRAEPGISLLRRQSRACVATARTLYEAILDEIVAADYDVLHRRAIVSNTRRFAVASAAMVTRLNT